MMVLSISGLVKNVYPVKTISELCIEVVSKKGCTMNQVTQTHIVVGSFVNILISAQIRFSLF